MLYWDIIFSSCCFFIDFISFYAQLPTIRYCKEQVLDLEALHRIPMIQFLKDHITVLGFLGTDP